MADELWTKLWNKTTLHLPLTVTPSDDKTPSQVTTLQNEVTALTTIYADTKVDLKEHTKHGTHREGGRTFTKAMKACYEYKDWVHLSNKDKCLVGKQTEAILYLLYDLPCFFSKAKLEIFLGFAVNNHNVKGALECMIVSKMIICKKDDLGTIQYYLGNFGMTLLGCTEHPDINNRLNKFLPSIIIHTRDGMKIINKRRDATTSKRAAVGHPAKVTPPANKQKESPKQTLSSSSEDDNDDDDDEEDKHEENNDVSNDNNQSNYIASV
jgi:hypothetical protein